MATHAAMVVGGARSVVVLATAVAFLLPLPARCASCSTGHDRSTPCAAQVAASLRSKIRRGEDADSHIHPPTCCDRQAAGTASTDRVATNSVHQSQHACGCGASSVPRTSPPIEKFTASPELSAGLAPVADLPFAPPAGATSTSDDTRAAPPPIPHRILHCSWII
jgi:hypothetical protein